MDFRIRALRWPRIAAAFVALTAALSGASARAQDPCNMAQLTQAVHDRPRDANAYVNRGACLSMPGPNGGAQTLKKLEAAVKDLEQALKLEPRNYLARHNLANVAYLLQYQDFAIYEFTQALAVNPSGARSYLGRGWAYVESCMLNQASLDFQRAGRLDVSLIRKTATPAQLSTKQIECSRPPPAPEYTRQGAQADPYFDHNSDYWRQRLWEERPH